MNGRNAMEALHKQIQLLENPTATLQSINNIFHVASRPPGNDFKALVWANTPISSHHWTRFVGLLHFPAGQFHVPLEDLYRVAWVVRIHSSVYRQCLLVAVQSLGTSTKEVVSLAHAG